MRHRWIALATLAVMAGTTLGGLQVAQAGSKGRRNTMIGLGAVTVYGLLTGRKTVAIAGGVGTAIAYHNYRAAKKRENRAAAARRAAYYRRLAWRRHHHHHHRAVRS